MFLTFDFVAFYFYLVTFYIVTTFSRMRVINIYFMSCELRSISECLIFFLIVLFNVSMEANSGPKVFACFVGNTPSTQKYFCFTAESRKDCKASSQCVLER